MRKLAALFLAALMLWGLLPAAGEGANAQDLTGEWVLAKMIYQGIDLDPAVIGLQMSATLNPDGTFTLLSAQGGDETKNEAWWKLEDGKILVSETGEAPWGPGMTVKEDSLVIDSNGNTLFLVRQENLEAFRARTQQEAGQGTKRDEKVELTPVDNEGAHRLEAGTFPVYIVSPEVKLKAELIFLDGVHDMPWIDLRELARLVNEEERIFNGANPLIDQEKLPGELLVCNYDEELDALTMTQTINGAMLIFDFGDNSILCMDYENLLAYPGNTPLDSVTHPGFNRTTGVPELFQRVTGEIWDQPGENVTLPLSEYGIELVCQNDAFLIPMHLGLDLVLGIPSGGIPNFFNGTSVCLGVVYDTDDGTRTELGEIYFGGSAPAARSEELTLYGVRDLCLELDYFYGLKEEHHIASFIDYIMKSPYFSPLLEPDPDRADQALDAVLTCYLDDGHTGWNTWSGMHDPDCGLQLTTSGYSGAALIRARDEFKAARAQAGEAASLPYYEVGNTAFVTFDHFAYKSRGDYYGEEYDISSDTVALIIYAHKQITREGSPIENVVLDLSVNGGGSTDAACFVMGWFLGKAPFSLTNTMTGKTVTAMYRTDVNLDREFDERDTLDGKNLYCLISPFSFSCGNLVPRAFKDSGRVILLGQTSGGGACLVQQMSTAWGTSYQLSGVKRLSFVKNGAYYDVDQGVTPDVTLTRKSTYYDREKLAEIINNLY